MMEGLWKVRVDIISVAPVPGKHAGGDGAFLDALGVQSGRVVSFLPAGQMLYFILRLKRKNCVFLVVPPLKLPNYRRRTFFREGKSLCYREENHEYNLRISQKRTIRKKLTSENTDVSHQRCDRHGDWQKMSRLYPGKLQQAAFSHRSTSQAVPPI